MMIDGRLLLFGAGLVRPSVVPSYSEAGGTVGMTFTSHVVRMRFTRSAKPAD